MNTNDSTPGRMLVHGQGSGAISEADIERRARELAAIDGRSGANINEDDLARARTELFGLTLPATTEDDQQARAAITRDPSEPASISGREAPNEDPDEEKALERLTLEGVEEAQHEQMLAARRRERQLDKDGGA